MNRWPRRFLIALAPWALVWVPGVGVKASSGECKAFMILDEDQLKTRGIRVERGMAQQILQDAIHDPARLFLDHHDTVTESEVGLSPLALRALDAFRRTSAFSNSVRGRMRRILVTGSNGNVSHAEAKNLVNSLTLPTNANGSTSVVLMKERMAYLRNPVDFSSSTFLDDPDFQMLDEIDGGTIFRFSKKDPNSQTVWLNILFGVPVQAWDMDRGMAVYAVMTPFGPVPVGFGKEEQGTQLGIAKLLGRPVVCSGPFDRDQKELHLRSLLPISEKRSKFILGQQYFGRIRTER